MKSIISLLTKGDKRSIKARKNIIFSFVIKAFGLILGFVKIPIILSYLDVDKYGIWLTISSIVLWVNYFDLGIGHGLRNKFAIALAENDKVKATKLVSTAYFYLSLIFIVLGIIILPFIWFLDWNAILNTKLVSKIELRNSVSIIFFLFIISFIANLITSILKADQKPALAESFAPIGSAISLVLVLLLSKFSQNSLFFACIAIALPPTFTVVAANFYFFKTNYLEFSPKSYLVSKDYFNDIFNLGMKFFVIQIGGLVMFSSSNIILTQVINPSEVAVFNIARQYYSLPLMLFSIVLLPFWSAITEAYANDELDWINKTLTKLFYFGVFFCFTLIVLFLIEDFVLDLWIKNRVEISLSVSLSIIILNICTILLSPYSHFINGVGKLNLSLYVVIFKTIVFLPTAILMTRILGSPGLIITLLIINVIPSSIIELLQFKKIINRNAKGIWNK